MPSTSGLVSLTLVCDSNCGLGQPHGDDGRQALAEVLAGGHDVLEDVFLLAVGVERAGQRGAEADEVRAAVDRVDVVGVAVDVLGVLACSTGRPLRPATADLLVLAGDVDHVAVDGLAGAVQVADELDDAVVVLEGLALAVAEVLEDDLHAAVEEGQLLQPLVEHVVVELQVAEHLVVGLEGGFRAGALGRADAGHGAGGLAALVFLLVGVAAAADLDLAPLGEEVHRLDADAVQAGRRSCRPCCRTCRRT